MKKKLSVIIALILTVVAAVFYGNVTRPARIYDNNVNTVSYTDLGVLTTEHSVSQEFTCRIDTVNGLQLKTGTAGDYALGGLHLEVKDAGTQEVLVSMDEPGSEFRPRKIHYFKTPELTGMKGRELTVTITGTGEDSANGITMYCAMESSPGHNAVMDGEELGGVLPLAVVAEGFNTETFVIFLLSVWFIWGFMWILYKLFQ